MADPPPTPDRLNPPPAPFTERSLAQDMPGAHPPPSTTVEQPPLEEVVPPGGAPVRDTGSQPEPTRCGVEIETGAPLWPSEGLCEDCVEALEERAAILEFEAGYSRVEAERRAWKTLPTVARTRCA